MTTIKDKIRDFGLAVSRIETEGDDPEGWQAKFDELLDETVEEIKERIIG